MPASRTPEGFPSYCPVCRARADIDFSVVGGDAPCPECGCLLRKADMLAERLRAQLAGALGVSYDLLTPDSDFGQLGADSLDLVEVVMEMEESLDGLQVDIPEEEMQNCNTLGDLVRLILRYSHQE